MKVIHVVCNIIASSPRMGILLSGVSSFQADIILSQLNIHNIEPDTLYRTVNVYYSN